MHFPGTIDWLFILLYLGVIANVISVFCYFSPFGIAK